MVIFMKLKNYEKKGGILFLIFILFLMDIFLFFGFYVKKFSQYESFQGIVQTNNTILFLVDSNQLTYFYQNHFIYLQYLLNF